MKINRGEMKYEARLSMRTHRPSVYLVTLLLMVLLWVLEILSIKLLYPGENLMEIARHYLASSEAQITLPAAETDMQNWAEQYMAMRAASVPATPYGRLLDVALSIMSLMLKAGFVLFCLNVARGAAAGPGTLLDAFGIFFKVLWLSILMSIFITLWTFLLIIPGIIAAYRYSFALFILLDDPDKSALECIRESKALTQGHKGELFVLDLSFLGWILLSIIPFVSIYTMPYIQLTKVNFYRHISGRVELPAELSPDDYTVE